MTGGKRVPPKSTGKKVPLVPAMKEVATKGKAGAKKETYDQYRRRYKAEHRAAARASTRDIGPVPPVKDKKRKDGCKRDLLGFLRTYLTSRFPLPFSQDHLDLIASIQDIMLHGGLRALAMPRGSGKTTILQGACLWALLFGHRRFLFVVAATGKAAKKIMANLQLELETNPEIFADFPEACHAIRSLGGVSQRAQTQTSLGRPTLVEWKGEEVRLPFTAAGGGSIIQISGITGAIRGANILIGEDVIRPDLCLVDDFQTRESAKSANQTANRLQIMQSDVLGLAGPGESVASFCACTIIQKGDGAAQILDRKQHPEWQGTTVRLMKAMPSVAAMVLWDQYTQIYHEDLGNDSLPQSKKLTRATLFYRQNREQMDSGAVAGWADRKLPGELSAVQHAMNLLIIHGEEAFWAEYQNAPRGLAATAALTQLQAEEIAKRVDRVPHGIVPNGTQALTAYIDLGEGCLWYHVGAFSENFAGHSVAYGGHPDPGRKYFTKSEMEGELMRVYPLGSFEAAWYAALTAICADIMDRDWIGEDGLVHRISLCLVDYSYGDSTDTVFKFCKESPWADRLLPSRGKGIGAKGKPMDLWPKEKGDKLGTGWRVQRNKNRRQKEVVIDTNQWKSFVFARLNSPMGGPSCFTLAGDKPIENEMFSHHLAAEYRVRVSAVGRVIDEWSMKPGEDNDLWDCTVGCHVAASIQGITITDKTAGRKKSAPVSFSEQQRLARERQTA